MQKSSVLRSGDHVSGDHGDENVSEKSGIPCRTCAARNWGFCRVVVGTDGPGAAVPSEFHSKIPPRQILFHVNERVGKVPVLREGWAIRFSLFGDGRRQILSVLLPGDVLHLSLLFQDVLAFSVQTLTPARYCLFDREKLVEYFSASKHSVSNLSALWADETSRRDRHLADIGRRKPDERVARFILDLMKRLAQKGLVEGFAIPFPLRQHHVADILGLSPVHVSRIFTKFRKLGIIDASSDILNIIDPARLQVIADMR